MINRLILIIIFGLILFVGSSFLIKPKVIEIVPLATQNSENFTSQAQLTENETITIILVGDIMLDRGVENMIKIEGNGDYKIGRAHV